jgi:hypothetical protein
VSGGGNCKISSAKKFLEREGNEMKGKNKFNFPGEIFEKCTFSRANTNT